MFFQNNLNKNLSEMYEFKILYDTHAINLNSTVFNNINL